MNKSKRRHKQQVRDARIKRMAKRINAEWTKFRHQSTPCSCGMCNNPRKHHKQVTLQEKISLTRMKEET